MSAENTLNKVLNILGFGATEPTKAIEVELAQKSTADEQAIFDSENFEQGDAVFIVTPDGNVPVPEGTYTLEDGMTITVDGNGVILQVQTAETEEVEAKDEEMKEQIDEEEMGKKPMGKKMESTNPKKVVKSKTEMEESYFSSDVAKKIADLEIKLSELKSENAELLDRLNKEEAPRTSYSPESQTQSNQMFKLGSKREETIEDRIYKNLF
jgi:hypothetical protein